jgi:hypothetical protein
MGYEQQIHEAALSLGGAIAAALKPARDWLARADELNKQLAAAREREEREYAQQVEAAASTGKLPSPNGFGTWSYDSPTSRLVVAAVAQCHVRAAGVARDAGRALFDALQRRVASIVDESVKLTKTLPPEVVDERSAMRASADGGKHFAAWLRLGELLAIWESCHELNRTMQRAHWCDGPGHAKDRPGAWTFVAYKVPHRLATIPRGTPRERHLAAAVAAGCEPGLYGWDDAVARFERLDRRQRDYRPMQVIQSFDSMGNLRGEQRSPETAGEWAPMAAG